LKDKLTAAQEDMEALEGAMDHVQSKADEFAEKKKKLESQIAKITGHLKNLQGVSEEDAEKEKAKETGSKTEEEGKKKRERIKA